MLENKAKDTFFSKNRSLNCRGRLLSLASPRVMGILNVTPDSFHDGGHYTEPTAAVDRAGEMLSHGADIIDVGAASSRPGAEMISPELELERLEPAMYALREAFPDAIVSIDTTHAQVAEKMVTDFGADLINDISAGDLDPAMFPMITKLKVPYIIMHMKGIPGNMQLNPEYQNVTDEIIRYFSEKVHQLHQRGVSDVMIDPGFGFGKNLEHNYELLSQVSDFQMFQLPIVAGVSRKSMISGLLGSSRNESLNGTTAVHMILLQKGVDIIRVHDVKEAAEAVTIFNETRTKTS